MFFNTSATQMIAIPVAEASQNGLLRGELDNSIILLPRHPFCVAK